MNKNKYKALIEMIEEVIRRLDKYKERTTKNYEWIQSEKNSLKKRIKHLREKIKDTEYNIYVLNNFETIIKNIINSYFKKSTIISAVVAIAAMTLAFGTFENPLMLLGAIPAGLALTAIGGAISFFAYQPVKDAFYIKRNKNLEEEKERKESLKTALELKQSSLEECIETEQSFKERLEYITDEISTYGIHLSNVIMAEGFANEMSCGDINEINRLFNDDSKTNEIMKLAREKLDGKQQN